MVHYIYIWHIQSYTHMITYVCIFLLKRSAWTASDFSRVPLSKYLRWAPRIKRQGHNGVQKTLLKPSPLVHWVPITSDLKNRLRSLQRLRRNSEGATPGATLKSPEMRKGPRLCGMNIWTQFGTKEICLIKMHTDYQPCGWVPGTVLNQCCERQFERSCEFKACAGGRRRQRALYAAWRPLLEEILLC